MSGTFRFGRADDEPDADAAVAPAGGADTGAGGRDVPDSVPVVDPTDLGARAARDIAEVPAIEVITTTAVHLMSAAAVACGLADDPECQQDLDEARKLIDALAGLVTASAQHLGDQHARSLRDGLRSLQLAFREASRVPDPLGAGPGERWTGPVL